MERPKLLLADDSVTIRKVVELTFADEGIEVTAVADADSAMQRFVETEPDIVLVDATLAGTSGYRICEMIKADDATKHIPVLLLVGSFERFDDAEAVRVGADGFMTKPFQSIRELVTKVRDLLDARDGTTSAIAEGAPPVPVFGEAFRDIAGDEEVNEPTAEEPEDDIDHLYRESFAPERAPEQSGLADDEEFLGDVGMDDDMIVASHQAPEPEAEAESPVPGAISIPLVENYDPDKKFDWSSEELVTDSGSEPESAQTSGFEPRFVFADDDEFERETAESELHSADAVETDQAPEDRDQPEIAGMDTIEMDRGDLHAQEQESVELSEEESEILDLDLDLDLDAQGPAVVEPGASVVPYEPERPVETPSEQEAEISPELGEGDEYEHSAPDQPADETDEEPDPAIHDTIPYGIGEQPPIEAHEPAAEISTEFPPEVIESIVQKVLERLSDSVVREVARIEVPRVAEKLIREALDGKR